MIYTIKPLVGVGDVKFGMTSEKVEEIWGSPISVTTTMLGEREERRADVTVRYDESGVVEFTFLPDTDLFIGRVNLFTASDPAAVLLNYDPAPKESLGFLIFFKIGVVITGYHDGEEDQRAITTFTGNRWDGPTKESEVFSP
jgi:hypothetical protein